jgi:hypothetical protein
VRRVIALQFAGLRHEQQGKKEVKEVGEVAEEASEQIPLSSPFDKGGKRGIFCLDACC